MGRADSTALSRRSLKRMRPEVQVLPGPAPALTSGNAGQCVWSSLGEECAESRTLTWLPLLVMSQAVTSPPVVHAIEPVNASLRVCLGAPTALFLWLGQGLSYGLGHAQQPPLPCPPGCGSEHQVVDLTNRWPSSGPMGSRRSTNTVRHLWPRGFISRPPRGGCREAKESCWRGAGQPRARDAGRRGLGPPTRHDGPDRGGPCPRLPWPGSHPACCPICATVCRVPVSRPDA